MGIVAWWRRIWDSDRRAQRALGDRLDSIGDSLRLILGATPPRRGSRELLKAYTKSPWLHAVVHRRADALAGTEWVLYRRKGGRRARSLQGSRSMLPTTRRRSLDLLLAQGELERIDEHPLLELLWQPNPVHTGPAFWGLLSKHLDLVGESFAGLERASQGAPTKALWPVVPTWVLDTPAPPDRPYYVVHPPMGTRSHYAAGEVWWMRDLDPADPYRGRGVGTAGALGDELETDEYMAMMAKSRFYNRAAPELIVGLLGATGPAGQHNVDKFMDEFRSKHRGPERAGQTWGVAGDVRVQHLGFNMVESQYVQGREFLRDLTMQVFGTPPEVLGVLDNANRSTIDAAETLFTKFSTEPALERIRAELEHRIAPEFGRDLWLDYVSPVPADREYERQIMVAIPAAFQLDEIRAQAGKGPLPDGAGKALYAQPGAGTVVNVNAGGDDDGADAALEGVSAEAVQDTALNGAQVASLLDTLVKVGEGVLPKDSAKAVIAAAFPALDDSEIAAMVEPLTEGSAAEAEPRAWAVLLACQRLAAAKVAARALAASGLPPAGREPGEASEIRGLLTGHLEVH